VSLFQTLGAPCPACGEAIDFEAVDSVNADRRPDLRAAILDNSFQRQACPRCGKTVRIEPELTYLDVARGQWILVEPATKLIEWRELENTARAAFALAFGPLASAPAQRIGGSLAARIAFGWPNLREKLLCRESGLDDVTVELLKLAVLRDAAAPRLTDEVELRVVECGDEVLTLAWLTARAEEAIEVLEVPRALYVEITDDETAWANLRTEVTAGPFVDIHRMLIAGEARE
jgi:endogenous inhibitor of DNA gyrase (YacG/DUF329 family)